ncbi:MAG: mucoidy inhibitor MuiA family protein [Planctomycetes bacterium]|nr:mucoidy inhibitor MuiA family protein [Planctomycetota bacterium]
MSPSILSAVLWSASLVVSDGEPPAPAPAPEAPITSVVVFPQHAEITREMEIDARAGANLVTFHDLVPYLNPHTLRASAGDGARITGTELRTVFLEESLSEEIAALDRAILEAADARAAETRNEARLKEEVLFYGAVKERLSADMGRQLAEGEVAVDGWKQVLGFVNDGLLDCDVRAGELGQRMRELDRKLATLSQERKEYAGQKPKEVKEVAVSFDSDGAGPRKVQIHYIVDAAVWKPSYDVHLDRATGEIEVVGYGQIVQWTGEAWPDVELTLAMSRPDFELAVPELQPLLASLDDGEMAQLAKEVSFLGSSASDQVQKWSETRFQRSQDRETFRRNLEQLSRRSDQHLAQYGLNRRLIEGALTRLADRFAAVRYEIPRRESIPYDSSPHKVVAFSARMPARLEYVATPALGNSVMLRGEIVNGTGVPVLEGGASLFVDGSYVGAGQVTSAAQNEPLAFSFGPDDALVVKRELVTRDVKGPEAFRQSQVITYHYAITVENFNERAVEVEVDDQIPVSKTDDIQVTFLGADVEPEIDETSGTLRWELGIAAGATSTIDYSFSVECPVGRDVHWN